MEAGGLMAWEPKSFVQDVQPYTPKSFEPDPADTWDYVLGVGGDMRKAIPVPAREAYDRMLSTVQDPKGFQDRMVASIYLGSVLRADTDYTYDSAEILGRQLFREPVKPSQIVQRAIRDEELINRWIEGWNSLVNWQEIEKKDERNWLEKRRDALARGMANVGSGLAPLMFTPQMATPLGVKPYLTNEQMAGLQDVGEETAKLLWEIAESPELAQQNEGPLTKALDMALETLPYITGTTAATILMGPAGGFGVGVMVEGNSSYRTAKKHLLSQGLPEDEAERMSRRIGLAVGLVSGAIESFGGSVADSVMAKATERITNRILRAGADFTVGTIIEAVEEGGQEISALTGESLYRDVSWKEAGTRILAAAGGGALLGGVFKTTSAAVRGVTSLSSPAEQRRAFRILAAEGELNEQMVAEIEQMVKEVQDAAAAESAGESAVPQGGPGVAAAGEKAPAPSAAEAAPAAEEGVKQPWEMIPEGEPILLWHGRRPSGSAIDNGGEVYLTPSKETAEHYSRVTAKGEVGTESGGVFPVSLRTDKILDLRGLGTTTSIDEFNRVLAANGIDFQFSSVWYPSTTNDTWMFFNRQIAKGQAQKFFDAVRKKYDAIALYDKSSTYGDKTGLTYVAVNPESITSPDAALAAPGETATMPGMTTDKGVGGKESPSSPKPPEGTKQNEPTREVVTESATAPTLVGSDFETIRAEAMRQAESAQESHDNAVSANDEQNASVAYKTWQRAVARIVSKAAVDKGLDVHVDYDASSTYMDIGSREFGDSDETRPIQIRISTHGQVYGGPVASIEIDDAKWQDSLDLALEEISKLPNGTAQYLPTRARIEAADLEDLNTWAAAYGIEPSYNPGELRQRLIASFDPTPRGEGAVETEIGPTKDIGGQPAATTAGPAVPEVRPVITTVEGEVRAKLRAGEMAGVTYKSIFRPAGSNRAVVEIMGQRFTIDSSERLTKQAGMRQSGKRGKSTLPGKTQRDVSAFFDQYPQLGPEDFALQVKKEPAPQPPAATQAEGKEPWRMTKGEFADQKRAELNRGGYAASASAGQYVDIAVGNHKEFIKQALSRGDLTPADAVAIHKPDYPDIESWTEYKEALAKQAPAEPPTEVSDIAGAEEGEPIDVVMLFDELLDNRYQMDEQPTATKKAPFIVRNREITHELVARGYDKQYVQQVESGKKPVPMPKSGGKLGSPTLKAPAQEAAPQPAEVEPAPKKAEKPKPQWGEKNKGVTLSEYEAIKARLSQKTGRLPGGRQAGATIMFDPQEWSDALKIGAFHFEAGARAFADWSAHMIEDMGDGIIPRLPEAWKHVSEEPGPAVPSTETETKSPEQKFSRAAQRVQEEAIAKDLTESLGELPTYETMSMAEQASMAAAEIEKDYENAKQMAYGKVSPPSGLRPASIYRAVAVRAREAGDVETLRNLAVVYPQISLELTAMGQQIKAADMGIVHADPVKAMQDVQKAKENAVAKRRKVKDVKQETKKWAKEAKGEIGRKVHHRQSWSEFVEGIRC